MPNKCNKKTNQKRLRTERVERSPLDCFHFFIEDKKFNLGTKMIVKSSKNV